METEIIFETIREINLHIATINGELGQVQIDVAVLKTQMTELMWWFRAIVGISIVLLVGQAWKVIVGLKNYRNKK